MSIKPWIKIISALSLAYYSANGLAQAPASSDPNLTCICYPKMDLVIKNFAFNDDQKQKVESMFQDYTQQKMGLRVKFLAINQEIEQLARQVPLDEAKLNDLIAQKAVLIAEKIKLHTLFKVKLYQMLTPDQQKAWDKIFGTQDVSELMTTKQ